MPRTALPDTDGGARVWLLRARSGRGAMALGLSTAVGHALSYGFSLVLSRALGPADFGALSALLSLAIIATVPASALQTQVARITALGAGHSALLGAYRVSWLIGIGLGAVVAVCALPLAAVLRLDSAGSVILVAIGLMPVSVIVARQGVLLGRGLFGLLAVTTVLVPALRLVSAWMAATAGAGVDGALGLQAVATWIGLGGVVLLVRRVSDPTATVRESATGGDPTGLRVRGVLVAGASFLGLFVLANVDVLVARTFLSDTQSGIYAVGAIGAKAVFWGSQFVALLVFPRVARGRGGRRIFAAASITVAMVGVSGALIAIPIAPPLIRAVIGSEYAEAGIVAPWFVVLGTLLALVQLTTYASVAADRHAFSVLLWFTLVAMALVVAFTMHSSVVEIVTVWIVGAGLLAVIGAGVMIRSAS